MQRTIQPELMSAPEAARFLSVHVKTIHRWAGEGLLDVIRIPGGRARFREKDLERFLDRNCQKAQAGGLEFQEEDIR